MMGNLKGKKIIVAGSARNIGKDVARKLSEEGAQLFLGDIDEELVKSVASDIGAGSSGFNLEDPESIEKFVAKAVDHLGGLDGVANIAANTPLMSSDHNVLEMDTEVWEKTLKSNLIGYAEIIKSALPHLIESESGAIVNVSSGSYFMGEPERPAYAASKVGVNALTRHVATKWGKDNIRCNAVAPGMVVTDSSEDYVTKEFIEEMLTTIPLPRLGKPSDISKAISFLLSDEAEWITGQVLSINGGAAYID